MTSSTPEQILASLIVLIKDLKVLYKREVEAMKKRDIKTFLDLQTDKVHLSRIYEIRVKEVQARTLAIKATKQELRDQVASEQSELETLAIESQTLALRMAEGVSRLQERLIEAARHALAQEKTCYTHEGEMNVNAGRPVATSINESF